jgi:hypothetical protein
MVYGWTLLSKPLDSTAVLSDADQAQATFVADLPGEYVVQLWIKDATEAQGIDRVTVTAAAGKCDLSPDDPGMLATHDMIRFLSWTGTLPGTVGSAVFQWRNGNGAARRYWIYESLAGDWLFFFRKNRIPKYDPGKPLAIHNNNYLAIAVPRIEFERWFWCGMPLYDIFGRFKGYGCHPEWGPDKPEILAPWVQQRIDESTPYVDELLEQAFGGTCP